MKEFYHNLTTEKSFVTLQELKRKSSFVLIGGWAVFLYSKTLKSKDIDIIVDYSELEKLRQEFRLIKNNRLKKYEIKIEEVDIDIYTPFFSILGLPAEEILKYTQRHEGFVLPLPEVLLILKIFVARQRKGTNKGRKDIIDIFSLLRVVDIDWKLFEKLIKKHKLKELSQQLGHIISTQSAIKELDLTDHKLSRLKKRILSAL